MTIEDLMPEDRIAVQEHYMRRWLAMKFIRGDRRATDNPPVVMSRWPRPWDIRSDLWPTSLSGRLV